MHTVALSGRDKKLLLGLAGLVLVCVLFTGWNYDAAFPSASLELKLSRDEIRDKARVFLSDRGLGPEGFRELTLFDPDRRASFYLERELGLEEANRLMRERIPVWQWRARWFRPPEQEERIVRLDPEGALVGFQHIVPEDSPGPRLSVEEARKLAEQFLADRLNAPHVPIEQSSQERPNRLDHTFTWELEGFRAGQAKLRKTVIIQGSEVGYYQEFLHIPEEWDREFAGLRSKNELYTAVAQAFYLPLLLAGIALLVRGSQRGGLAGRSGLLIAGAVGLLTAINEWNLLPFVLDQMPTSSSYGQTLAIGVLQGLGSGVGTFLYVLIAALAGEWVYRRSFAGKLQLGAFLTPHGIHTREFFLAAVTGYSFAAVHIAYVVAFYLVGQRFGVWSPQDVPYSDLLSTAFPWIYPLSISAFASVSEEFWFRLLAIPLLLWLVPSRWLAILVPAFVWGFLHSNYPQQPGYIRGLEVGLIGVGAGWLMLRFGIAATVIWHYTVDAVLIGIFLFQAESLQFRLSGLLVAAVVLLPLGVSIWSYRKRGGFIVDAALENPGADEKSGRPEEPERAPRLAPPAAPWPRVVLLGAAALALAGGWLARPQEFGRALEVSVSREQAVAAARSAVAARATGSDWEINPVFRAGIASQPLEYLRQKLGPEAAEQILLEHMPGAVWAVRFFRPLEPEGWYVRVDAGSGKVLAVDHTLPEATAGARLDRDAALAIAREELARFRAGNGSLVLVDSSSEERVNRTDHYFVFRDTSVQAAEAEARIAMSVLGDQPSGPRRFMKLPEEWEREYLRPRLEEYLPPGILGGLAIPLLVFALRRIGVGGVRLRWGVYLTAGIGVAFVLALGGLNTWNSSVVGYDTAKPWTDFISQVIIGRATYALLAGFGAALLAMLADLYLQENLGPVQLPAPDYTRAAAVAALLAGVGLAAAGLESWLPGERTDLPVWSLTGADSALPAFSVLGQALVMAVYAAAGLAAVTGGFRLLFPAWRGALVIGLCAAVAAWGSSRHWAQFAAHLAVLLLVPVLLRFLWKTVGADLIALGVGLFWVAVSGPAWRLTLQPDPWLAWNGAGTLTAATLLGVAAIAWGRRYLPAPLTPEELRLAAEQPGGQEKESTQQLEDPFHRNP